MQLKEMQQTVHQFTLQAVKMTPNVLLYCTYSISSESELSFLISQLLSARESDICLDLIKAFFLATVAYSGGVRLQVSWRCLEVRVVHKYHWSNSQITRVFNILLFDKCVDSLNCHRKRLLGLHSLSFCKEF